MTLFTDEPIRALCFWQPFGSLMLHGKVETRAWPTDYRGKILICTTKKGLHQQRNDASLRIAPHYNAITRAMESESRIAIDSTNPKVKNTFTLSGYAIAIGDLVDCRKVKKDDNTFFQHWPELYAHIYENVQRIEPFEFTGFQGKPRLIDADTRAKIKLL